MLSHPYGRSSVGKEIVLHPYGAISRSLETLPHPYGDPSGGKIQLFGKCLGSRVLG